MKSVFPFFLLFSLILFSCQKQNQTTTTDYTQFVDPLIGTETDYSALADLLAIPGFDLENYVKIMYFIGYS